VIVYHVIYMFNSVGVVRHITETGIPAFDTFCYFVYPWLMTLMFLLAGISVRYALQKYTAKQYLKERFNKLIIPFFGGMFLLGWINGLVLSQFVDMFGENPVPSFIKYIVFSFAGMGPLWFIFQLFIVTIVLLLIRKVDKNDKIWALAGKANIFILLALVIPFWGSSFLFNMPIVTVFRNGIYLFVFLAGYYFFSHDKTIETLAKFGIPLLVIGTILGTINVYYFYGDNFSENIYLQHPLTNAYAWAMMLAILGFTQKYFNKTNKFMDYVKSRSFFWYLCHYPIMVFIAYIIISFIKVNMIINYTLLLVFAFGVTILFCEIVRLIPVLRYLLFGIKKRNK